MERFSITPQADGSTRFVFSVEALYLRDRLGNEAMDRFDDCGLSGHVHPAKLPVLDAGEQALAERLKFVDAVGSDPVSVGHERMVQGHSQVSGNSE
ncbi:hypothetical protein [Methylorubrum thiocyanatum]|uniref:hypothetical protein n=1 Tax=Methylorubrum thiocyanatum TaxID=47958 RepID=UPI0036622200